MGSNIVIASHVDRNFTSYSCSAKLLGCTKIFMLQFAICSFKLVTGDYCGNDEQSIIQFQFNIANWINNNPLTTKKEERNTTDP
jgi:hypothetical protein